MPFLIQYIIKLSICLALVYIFYRLFLRKLTFYNWNRWYLLVYTLLSFYIPFINITPTLEKNELGDVFIISYLPGFQAAEYNTITNTSWRPDKWDFLFLFIVAGSVILLTRVIIQYLSYRKLKSAAKLLSVDGMKIYQVEKNITPFSFGNAVFINIDQHTGAELEDIIRHEFVHVKQKHTMDILWAELICMLCWFNPFAWLIRKSVRQNLEFIADNQVLKNGTDRKQYQYLLLKVIGNNSFSIANNFNFSSLKKRIAMMNKMQSARVHLVKFLFLIPLVAVLLLAFRNRVQQTAATDSPGETILTLEPERAQPDTTPALQLSKSTELNRKGYLLSVADDNGECIVLIRDNNNKIVKAMTLVEWDANEKQNVSKYGEIPPVKLKLEPVSVETSTIHPDQVYITKSVPSEITVTGYKKENLDIRPVTVEGYYVSKDNAVVTEKPVEVTVTGYKKENLDIKPVTVEGYYVSKDNTVVTEKPVEVTVTGYKKEKQDLKPVTVEGYKSGKDKTVATEKPVEVTVSGYKKENLDIKPVTVEGYRVRKDTSDDKEKPIYIIDGKKLEKGKDLNEALKPNDIKSINVLKDGVAVDKYGEKGKNGVIEINTKGKGISNEIRNSKALILIDGEELPSGQNVDDVLRPEEIKAIDVLKGDDAMKYGIKGKNGVILITTKKGKPVTSNKFRVTADQLEWDNKNQTLSFAGSVEVKMEPSVSLSSDTVVFRNADGKAVTLGKNPLLVADGLEIESRNTNLKLSHKMVDIEMLAKSDAIMKYGEKAKDGAIIINPVK